jgi:general secretion pathway protein G
MQRNRTRTGFTLVEVLMVAVILAILAVIVVPQFSDASADVKTSALRSSLHTIRSQLELYKAQHNGTPNATSGKYGPYLQSVPPNPIDDNATIATTQDATGGWAYDAAAGTFKSNDSTVLDTDSKTKNL